MFHVPTSTCVPHTLPYAQYTMAVPPMYRYSWKVYSTHSSSLAAWRKGGGHKMPSPGSCQKQGKLPRTAVRPESCRDRLELASTGLAPLC